MRLRVIAVGTRMPRWVREAFDDYTGRLSGGLKLSLVEIDPGARGAGRAVQQAVDSEAQRITAALRKDEYVVALDEHGQGLTTRELSTWLATRMQGGRDVALLIGGPDGLAAPLLARAEFKWSLSPLTFPHALVRVVLAEQLYRAQTVLNHHPYHRD
jgi:23S rRNA (pseudouridine1915-N3)-methyltransferase